MAVFAKYLTECQISRIVYHFLKWISWILDQKQILKKEDIHQEILEFSTLFIPDRVKLRPGAYPTEKERSWSVKLEAASFGASHTGNTPVKRHIRNGNKGLNQYIIFLNKGLTFVLFNCYNADC